MKDPERRKKWEDFVMKFLSLFPNFEFIEIQNIPISKTKQKQLDNWTQKWKEFQELTSNQKRLPFSREKLYNFYKEIDKLASIETEDAANNHLLPLIQEYKKWKAENQHLFENKKVSNRENKSKTSSTKRSLEEDNDSQNSEPSGISELTFQEEEVCSPKTKKPRVYKSKEGLQFQELDAAPGPSFSSSSDKRLHF